MSNTDTIELIIDEKAHSYARIYSSLLSDEFQRKRAYASISALFAFVTLLEKTPNKIQKSMTLFRNPIINEQYEISDLYVNNWHLDIRVVTGGDAVLVPKIHYDSNIVPDYYVVIKVDSEIKNAQLVGIADTSSVKAEGYDYHYFSIAFKSLISYEEFLEKIKDEKETVLPERSHTLFRESYLGIMDNEIDTNTKNEILKHVFECRECRTEFCCFTGFEMVSENASKYPEILDDQTLGFIGAQKAEDKEYEGKEETVYIGDDKNAEESVLDDETEETVSDILDELFNDEEFTKTDTPEEKPIETSLEDISVQPDTIKEINEDIEIINEDKQEENLPEMLLPEESDLQIITDEDESNVLKDDGFEIIGQRTIEELNENIDEKPVIIEEETPSNSSENNIQKVIIDYDEYGEPIYSYITNVDQNNNTEEDINSEIIPIDDEELDIKEEVSEEEDLYPETNIENIEEEDISLQEEGISEEELLEDKKDLEILPDTETESENIDKNLDIESEEITPKTEDDIILEEENTDNQTVHPYEEELKEAKETSVPNIKDIELEEDDEEYTSGEVSEIDNKEDTSEEFNDESEAVEQETDEETEEETEEYESGEYDDYDIEDVLPKENSNKSKAPLIILFLVIILGLAGAGSFFLIKNNKTSSTAADIQNKNTSAEIPSIQQTNDMFEEMPEENENQNEGENNNNDNDNSQQSANPEENNPPEDNVLPPLTEGDLIASENNNNEGNGDVNQVLANAFSQGSSVSLRGLNWFCTSELFSDKTFKNYLQNLDNTLKQNLRNNIMNVSDTPPKNSVAAKFAVDNNGNLQKVIISDSSGSEEIDNIVLQSINESFEGEKSQILNDSTLKSDMYYLKV
ncbi:MAG: DUF1822 family protein, partial [Candidatus Gastranaerophilales bacterium]|nr:DUF1822 family protein [Candidatus Gastranaerophilales bacterium]